MARRTKARFHGVLLVDKPPGITSHDVVLGVRRRFGQRQVGHAGTLDPLASGLLPVLLGQATKLSTWATETDKAYRVTARLGVQTDTQDADGHVVATAPVPADLTAQEVEPVLGSLTGAQMQRVPRYSAVKVDGKRLYARARDGEVVEPPERPIVVHRLELTELCPPDLTLDVACSKGTYVRALVSDLGDRLGPGAHVTVLRRTGVGPVGVDEATPLQEILEAPDPGAYVLPAVGWLRRLVDCLPCGPEQTRRVRQGQRPSWEQLGASPLPPGARFALVGAGDELIAIAESVGDARGSYKLRKVFPPIE